MPRPLDEVLQENWGYSGTTDPVKEKFGWGDRFGAAIDNAQSQLLSVAEAAGVDSARDARRDNQWLGERTRMRAAQDTNAPTSYKDVHGVGDAARYVGGLAVDSAPQLLATAAVGAATGGAGLGLSIPARLAAAGAANYPFNLGDVLQNQREQAGTTDLPSAAALAVPYTAADVGLGVEARLARTSLARNTIGALDRVEGKTGALARTASSVGRTALEEGAGEAFQEGMNQFGRMAVDPNQRFLDDDSMERFKENFVGGAALGGAFGGMGGWRRSEHYQAPVRTVDEGATDLLSRPQEQRQPLQLSAYAPDEGPLYARQEQDAARAAGVPVPGQYDLFNPDGSPTYGADPSFGDTNPLRPAMRDDFSTSLGAASERAGIPFQREVDTRGLSLVPRIDDGRTLDMFTGEPTHAPVPLQQFELTPPDMSGANQGELDLQPPTPPAGPVLPQGNQRGVPGQLPFSGNTHSPKGQVLQGLVDSLATEGHLDDGAKTQASTLIARGRFGDAKKILDEAIKNKSAADALLAKAAQLQEKADGRQSGAAEQRTGDTTAGGRVQRDGSQRNAAPVQPTGAARDSAGADSRGGENAPAVPADAEHRAALEGVTSEALTQVADDAKDPGQYESTLDELYRRWRDDGDEVASKYFEDNAHVPGFAADLARVRERAGENKPAAPAAEGKRGIKLGRHPQGNLSEQAKETDSVLRGLATPKFRTREDASAGGMSAQELSKAVDDVKRAVPGANIEVHDTPEAAGIKGPPGGATPMGVTLGDGRVMLFRQGLANVVEAQRTAFHELFHHGLRNWLPEPEYHKAMDALYAADPEVQKRAHAWGNSPEAKARKEGGMSNRDLRSLAIEEALAEMAEDLKTQKPSTIRAIAGWFADIAHRLGMRQLAQWLRRADLTTAQKFIEEALSSAGGPATVAEDGAKFKTKNTAADDAVAKSFATFPGSKSTLGQKIQDALFNLRESPWALKWVTNDQIAEGYKHLKPVQDINRATMRMASVANRYLETATQTAKKWRALSDDVQLAMQRTMLKSTMDQMHVSIKADGKYLGVDQAWKHADNAHLERDKPEVKRAFYELYREFHALPNAAKVVYDTVRDDFKRQHDDTLKALRKSVADQYAGQLHRMLTDEELTALANSDAGVRAAFKQGSDLTASATELRALEGLYQALRDLNRDFGTVRGPYFPLVRFGDHVVVMKDRALVDMEMEAQRLRLELQNTLDKAPAAASEEAEAHNALVAETRNAYNRALDKVNAAKQDERKYIVEFHETPADAERARQALAAKFPEADVYRSVREQYYRALDGASPAFLNDLVHTLSAALDAGDGVSAEAKSTAVQSLKDMYLRRQPERSALRSELKRMNIEGVQSAQMLRGYASASRNGAWRISRLLHAGEVTQGLASLSEDRRSADAKHVLNELKARFVGDIAPPESNQWLQRLQNATYFMHLGFNISYYVTNATQAWTTSLPVMAGRHGIMNSSNSLMAASRDVIRLLSKATAKSVEENGAVVGLQLRLSDEQIASLAKDAGEAQMLRTLTDDGVIDITIKHDLGTISDGTSKSIPGKVMEMSSALANYTELYNRLATALAAYRMEAARREGTESDAAVQERAQAYAENVINRTHFNYSPENAPRVMRGQLGRLVFQFKRYQQGMIYLFAKLVRDASNGDADARRSLAYLLGTTTAIGGVAALPVAAPVAFALKVLAAAYPDDDEPDWLQQWYNGMKDALGEGAAQVIAKGAPTMAGLDLSKKLGAGDLLNPLAFANTDGKKFFSRDYWAEVGFALLGPGAAVLGNEAEAVGYAKAGDYLKAAEKGMPTFVANAVKAFRRADEGLTTKQGDTIMEPEEFNALSVVAKAAGFESAKVSDTYDNRSSYLQGVQNRKEARQALLRQYYEAVKSGDSDAMESVRDAINEFNTRQPADKVRGQDLSASIKQHRERAAQTRGGLRVGKRDADTYTRLMGE